MRPYGALPEHVCGTTVNQRRRNRAVPQGMMAVLDRSSLPPISSSHFTPGNKYLAINTLYTFAPLWYRIYIQAARGPDAKSQLGNAQVVGI